jgi:hypothetical protein
MLAPTMLAEFLSTSASYAKLAQDFRARGVAFATLGWRSPTHHPDKMRLIVRDAAGTILLTKRYANWPSEALKLKLQFVAVLLSQII